MSGKEILIVIEQFKKSHEALLGSLREVEPKEAFEGSQWSISDVLIHLNLSKFIDALEKIVSQESLMLPKYETLEVAFESYISEIKNNHERLIQLLQRIPSGMLDNKVTEYNPENNYPALTLLDLLKRMSKHEFVHAQQIVNTLTQVRNKD
jgi:hypothetical protein